MLNKINFQKLNGWQRLFVLFAIFWTIGCLADFKLVLPDYVNVNDKEQYGNYVSANLDKYLPKHSSPPSFDPDLYLNPPKAVMSDGVTITLYTYTKDEVAAAYEKFKADPQNLNPNKGYFLKMAKELIYLLLMYLMPLISIYLLGWMIAWVIRGFRKQP